MYLSNTPSHHRQLSPQLQQYNKNHDRHHLQPDHLSSPPPPPSRSALFAYPPKSSTPTDQQAHANHLYPLTIPLPSPIHTTSSELFLYVSFIYNMYCTYFIFIIPNFFQFYFRIFNIQIISLFFYLIISIFLIFHLNLYPLRSACDQ